MLQSVPLALALVFPWLNPIASGPSPSVTPWIMSTMCALLVAVSHRRLTTRVFATSWLIAAAVSAGMGLLQYFGMTQNLSTWVHTTSLGDAFANLRQRNQFATLTSIGLVSLLWLDLKAHKTTRLTNIGRTGRWVWVAPVLLTLALGNAASSSRTGMLQWGLVFGCTVLWAPALRTRAVALASIALLSYGVAVVLLPTLLEAWSGIPRGNLFARFAEDSGCGDRRVLWANVLHLIAQKPWTGWGWGELDYAHFITLYPGERFCDILDNAHNLPLHLAVELGVPVALGLGGLLLWWVARNAPWAETNTTRQMAWAVLAVIGLHSLLEYPLWYGPFQLAVALCVFLLWQTRGHRAESRVDSTPITEAVKAWTAKSIALSGVAIMLLLVLATAAWDYWRISQLYLLPADRAPNYREQTLDKVKDSWFFQDQVQFAELTTTSLTKDNADSHYAQALHLLHFSPEPRVIEALIESAVMLGKDQDALFYLQRYKAAFPQAHAHWAAASERFKVP